MTDITTHNIVDDALVTCPATGLEMGPHRCPACRPGGAGEGYYTDERPHLDASAQAARRALAVEWARTVLDSPIDTGAYAQAEARHVIRVLVGELARLEQRHEALTAHARRLLNSPRPRA